MPHGVFEEDAVPTLVNGTIPLSQLPTSQPSVANTNLVAGWNANFLTALASSGSQVVRLALVGDSLTQGMFASNLLTTSWAALMTVSLQSTYGDGGSGFRSPAMTDTWLTQQSVNSGSITAYKANNSVATTTGTWGNNTAVAMAGIALTTTDASAGGATITDVVRGSTIKIYTLGNGGANATCSYTIDGGSPVTITDTATGIQPVITTITGLTAASHTVVLKYTDAGVKSLFYAGMEAYNATGLVVDNFGVYGIKASQIANQSKYNDSPQSIEMDWMGGYRHPADGVIVALGANDAAASGAIDTYSLNMRQILTRLREGAQNTHSVVVTNASANPSISVLILMHHIGAFDGATATTPVWHDYTIRMTALAKSFNASLVNLWADGRGSWNAWKTLSYWGLNTTPGSAGSDPIHLSNAGHTHIASIVQSVLTTSV